MAKIEYVEQRLLLWAEWVERGGWSAGGGLAMFNGEPSYWRVAYNIPLNDEQCWATNKAVEGLPAPLSDTTASYYLLGGNQAKARHSISAAVLSQRLDRAHRLLHAQWQPATLSENSQPSSFTGLTK